MKYISNHCITTLELFKRFNKKKLKLTKKIYNKDYKTDSKLECAAKIFNYCLYLIILDIIENNVIFVLPSNFGKQSELSMKTFEGDEFKKVYKLGKFRDVDFVMSNFRGHQIVYTYETRYNTYVKQVYVNSKLKNIITKKTNEGCTYL